MNESIDFKKLLEELEEQDKEEHFHYRNFKMGIELDIAGTFLYDGINSLRSMDNFEVESEVFSFLYHISVGIERLQKIIIVLNEEIKDIKEFEDSLKTHSHQGLHNRIKENRNVDFNSRQNEFLSLVSDFYNNSRYNNYLVSTAIDRDIKAIKKFLDKHTEEILNENYFGENLDRRKEILGRVIGSIVKEYYSLIQKICGEKNIYTDEVRADSKALQIFLRKYQKNSLSTILKEEGIAVKELLIYLSNSEENSDFMDFLRGIEPLGIDIANIKGYISSIINGKVPQDLIYEIEELYCDEDIKAELKNRLVQLEIIGNKHINFYDE
ncbi:hypothetical protein ICM_05521 [Bacillus cereus BAG1X2-3]|uniref:Uncharacterized protein n=1 Tax=Bacillus cereus TaxID=1396 RepID=A0A9X7HMT7_BACCE|nr:hypothetical protein [Bacillus cereus]EOO23360.1 hypothetical protein ICC_06116 [Bacillus cereus BAG1X1-1]EOO43007.1 hypothetical protein ICI_06100 [Bacillus cereus BAG1X2-1]EOO56497.1 hypothetical protein ICM_05521 [Bacillus cereus BAG1X2-3]EOP00028.1 hypothetical protein ICO_06573 [Bacillus cereus BAG2O-1]PHA10674.1 hypothetical protein COE70_30695 [Bacillus cereus]